MRALFHMGVAQEIWPGKPLVYCPPNWSEERPMSHTVNTPPHVHPSIHVRIHRSENKSSPVLSRMYVCDIHWVSWVKKQTLWGGVSIVGHAKRCEGTGQPGSRGWGAGVLGLGSRAPGLARQAAKGTGPSKDSSKGTGSSKDGSGP